MQEKEEGWGAFLAGVGVTTPIVAVISAALAKPKDYEDLKRFHSEWIPFVNRYKKRLELLNGLKISPPSGSIPPIISYGVAEAISAYLFGLDRAACAMAVRVVELGLKERYKEIEARDPKTKQGRYLGLHQLIDWALEKGILSKEDNIIAHDINQIRSYVVHDEPDEMKETDTLYLLESSFRIIEKRIYPKTDFKCMFCPNSFLFVVPTIKEVEDAIAQGNKLNLTCPFCEKINEFEPKILLGLAIGSPKKLNHEIEKTNK